MRKMIFKDNLSDGTIREREIKRITKKEAKDYKLLGRAFGESYGFCMYLAHKHCPNFRKRVVAFRIVKTCRESRIIEDVTKKKYLVYEFYEK